jgi:hypothetical protein
MPEEELSTATAAEDDPAAALELALMFVVSEEAEETATEAEDSEPTAVVSPVTVMAMTPSGVL